MSMVAVWRLLQRPAQVAKRSLDITSVQGNGRGVDGPDGVSGPEGRRRLAFADLQVKASALTSSSHPDTVG